MDFEDSPADVAVRQRITAWLDDHASRIDADSVDEMRTYRAHTEEQDVALVDEARAWQRTKSADRWAAPHWPRAHGGLDAPGRVAEIFAEEERNYDVPRNLFTVGVNMAGPTIIEWGTDAQRRELLPRILDATDIWCQLFSEPGAGSDLAGLSTRAVRDGDDWVVTGQKVWTTGAHYSNRGLVLVRTDIDAPKHRGITCLLLDMDADGVEVRPLRQIDGAIHFNEVFLDEVRVPVADTLGPVGGGWGVALSMLAHERASIGSGSMFEMGHMVALARSRGLLDDRSVRQRLADLHIRFAVLNYLGLRVRTATDLGVMPGPEGSVMKLAVSAIYERGGDLMMAVQGADGMLSRGDAPYEGRFVDLFLAQWAPRIGGGTDQIQRNIIGEHVLGLPAEPRLDKGIPFRQIGAPIASARPGLSDG